MLHEPPKGKEARSGDLLHAAPVGRATGPAPPISAAPAITPTTNPLGKPSSRE
jgi:hypothetical protein